MVQTVGEISENLTDAEGLEWAAGCLRTIAHPIRLRIIQLLLQGPLPVGELAEACSIPSHMMSEHLRIMKDRGFLGCDRQGRKIFYRVIEPCLHDLMKCVQKKHF